MSPRPEERDDVAERWTYDDDAHAIRVLREWEEAALSGVHPRVYGAAADLIERQATELAALRSERDEMAARIADFTEAFVEGLGASPDILVGRSGGELASLIVIRLEEVYNLGESGAKHDAEEDIAELEHALSEYRGDERMGVERIEGWAHIALEDDGWTRDNLCSCDKAGSWEFHADCGHVGTHTPATLLLRRRSPASEPGPANPADPSPREEP